MQLTIDVPDAQCTRCGNRAAMRPQTVSLGPPPSKSATGFRARSDDGQEWCVTSAQLPARWATGPLGGSLCPACAAAWEEASASFRSERVAPQAIPEPPAPPPPLPQTATPPPSRIPGGFIPAPAGATARVWAQNQTSAHAPPVRSTAPIPTPVASPTVTKSTAQPAAPPPQTRILSTPLPAAPAVNPIPSAPVAQPNSQPNRS